MGEAGKPVSISKSELAIAAAVAACDHLDGLVDSTLRDPRACNYSATALIASGKLTAGEAKAIDMIWEGSVRVSTDSRLAFD